MRPTRLAGSVRSGYGLRSLATRKRTARIGPAARTWHTTSARIDISVYIDIYIALSVKPAIPTVIIEFVARGGTKEPSCRAHTNRPTPGIWTVPDGDTPCHRPWVVMDMIPSRIHVTRTVDNNAPV